MSRTAKSTISATSVAISEAARQRRTTSATWASPRCGSRLSSRTPTRRSPAATPSDLHSFLTDQGKAGYHGYWGMNFFESTSTCRAPGLDFAGLMRRTACEHGLKASCSTSSATTARRPLRCRSTSRSSARSSTRTASLVADHQNLPPEQLDPAGNPLHAFYNTNPISRELGDLNADNPAVMEYLVGAVPAVAGPGCRRFPHRHDPAHAACILEGFRRAHAREASRVSSCSAKRSATMRARSPPHTRPRTAATACSTSR